MCSTLKLTILQYQLCSATWLNCRYFFIECVCKNDHPNCFQNYKVIGTLLWYYHEYVNVIKRACKEDFKCESIYGLRLTIHVFCMRKILGLNYHSNSMMLSNM